MAKMHDNGGLVGKTLNFNSTDAYTTGSSNKKNSGIWNIGAAVKTVPVDYSGFSDTGTISEGQAYTKYYNVTGVADGVTVGWTTFGTGINASDFVYGATGTATITGGQIPISFEISADAASEGIETVNFTLAATDSAGNSTVSAGSVSYNIEDTSRTVSYGASTAAGYTNSPGSQNEGTSITYYFYTANRSEVTPVTMYWSINATTSDFQAVSGTCNYVTQVNNYPNSGDIANIYSVTLTILSDATTEGTEYYTLSFRESSTSGTVRATAAVTVNDTSKSVSYGVYQYSDQFPNEGTTPFVDFYVTNSTPNMYWSIDSGTSDFATGSGTIGSWYTTVSNYPSTGDTAYLYKVSLSVTADSTTEGAEDHFVRFRTGSTSGTIVATGTLTVQDTSTTPPAGGGGTPELSPVLLTVSGQYSTTSYSSHSIDLSSYVGSTGRLVMWYETGTTYTGDLQIDNVSLNGTTYSFESNAEGWQTTTGDWNTSSATTAHYESLLFADVLTGTSGQQWLRDSGGTGSSGTGLTSGSSGSFYLYAETSGSGWPWSMWLRSPEVTLTTGNCTFDLGRYGAAIGTARFYWYGTIPITGTDYTSSFTQIASRHIDSDLVMGSTVDYTGSYDVHVTEPVLWTGTTGRVYLGTKITSSTNTFYSDIPIACVQHFNSSGTLLNSWNFSSSTGGTGSSWTTTTVGVAQPDPGMTSTPAAASAYGYSAIAAGASVNRFNWATSTGSSYTGAGGGISTTYNTSPITTSVSTNDAIPQVDTSYYMYVEASGSVHNQAHFARSPLVTINNGDYFKIVYAVTGYSVDPQNPNDCLWFAIY